MSFKTWMRIIALPLFAALAITVPLVAQNNAKQNQPHQYHHYQLVDPGTFGGPQSGLQAPPFPRNAVLNNQGTLITNADTLSIDPYCGDYPDCYAADGLQFRNGVATNVGVLPGGIASQINWISANGLMVGNGDNGLQDPLDSSFPQIHPLLWDHGTMTDLGTLPEGGYIAAGAAVNSRGEVVGFGQNTVPDANAMGFPGYQSRAFYWKNGVMQDLGTLGTGTDAAAVLINELGQVVGWSYTNSTPSAICVNHGWGFALTTSSFIWDKHHGMRDIGGLGGTCTIAQDINIRGQIVGTSALTGDPLWHPFVWESAAGMTDLMGASNGFYGYAEAINDRGQIAGEVCDAVTCYAALWQKSGGKWHTTDLGTFNGCADARSVNASAQVVGTDWCAGVAGLPFLSERGGPVVALSTLVSNSAGLQLNEAVQINNRGEIAVNSTDSNNNNHAILLIPCDENHPGVAGCDYSTVDVATAALVNPAPTLQQPAMLTPSGQMPGLLNRFRSPTNQRVPGHAPAPEASLAVPATPDTGDWLGDHQLVPHDGNPQYGNPSPYCAISNGTLTGTCVQSTGAYNCNLTFTGCPMGQPASGNYSYLCDGGHSYVAISSTKCFSVPGFDVSTTALTPTTVTEGGSATSTLTVSAYGGFGGSVTFTCSVQPTAAPAPTCLFSPRSVTSGTPVALTVTTTAPTSALRTGTRSGLLYAFFLPLSGLFAMVLRLGPQQKRDRRITAVAFACALFAGVVFQAACGAKPPTPGTPAGEYSITVTGTSGTLVNSFTVLPLTVQ
jgi:probable HAF family extracellular repeat protein